MKVTFLGAAKTVTGSNFLVEGAGKKFLVDCGMYQGAAAEELENSAPFMFNIDEIDFMLLTHAHIDHSGRIPKLYNEGYRNPIFATKATCDLCSIMLPDSGHIQEMEIEWKNRKRMRKGEKPLPPLYTAEDAAKSLEIFTPVQYDQLIEIDENIHVRFNDAGHMLGSAIIEVWIKEDGEQKKIVFTGDLGNNDIPLLSSPTMIEDTDYLVMESTYGNRLHLRNDDKAELFLKIVYETLEKGGTVVIPSFAVGRTQEVLYELNKIKDVKHSEEFYKQYQKLMSAHVYVDSPLAISATEVFRENMNLFNEETQELIQSGDNPLEFPGLEFTILFVGYQAPGTLGRKLVDGEKRVTIFGEEIAVNARIEYIEGYSGHADQEWLMNFVYSFIKKPTHIFLVHGEPEGQIVLKQKLEEETKIPVTIPSLGETYDLSKEIKVVNVVQDKLQPKFLRLEVIERMKTLKEELEDMETIVKEDYLNNNTDDSEIVRLKDKLKELENQNVRIVENK